MVHCIFAPLKLVISPEAASCATLYVVCLLLAAAAFDLQLRGLACPQAIQGFAGVNNSFGVFPSVCCPSYSCVRNFSETDGQSLFK